MKLKVTKRQNNTKGETKRLRREDKIPAVIYSKGEEGECLVVEGTEFSAALRQTAKGGLPTTIFTLVDDVNGERRAIVKGIQYHPTTYDILHLDFEELHDDVAVDVKVPIRYKGDRECPGVKLGGVLRPIIRHLKVRCLPTDIPKEVYLDVSKLDLKASMRLGDVKLPENVKPRARLGEVAVVVAKR